MAMLFANNYLKEIKLVLIICIGLFQITGLEAAPNKNQDTLEAIWENPAITDRQTTQKKIKPLTQQQLKQRRLSQQQNKKPVKYSKAQYQRRFKLEQELKLNRQRAAWRKKWEAQQRAKKNQEFALAKYEAKTQQPLNRNTRKHAAKLGLELEDVALLNKNVTPIRPARLTNNKTQPLTRAQYHERWRQAQLKKPANPTARQKQTVLKNTNTTNKKRAAFTLPASYRSLPFEVKHKLRAARLSESGMSAYVQDVNSNKPLLAHKETISRVPASVMKLITSYAALGILGPNYRWPLDVYTRGTIKNGTLHGDLIIKGYGSPEFNTSELRKLLRGIRQKGIRGVQGRLVFDNSYFSIPRQSAGAFDGKAFASYNAQPDALLYNERISSFQVSARGKRVHVSTSTPAYNLKIVNRMRKSRRGCRPRISISHRGSQVIATFSGRYARRCGVRTYSRVISKPAEMVYGAIKAMWQREVGGKLNARFAMGVAPTNAKPLLRIQSRTLAQILPTIDKESNNVMARQLLLTIGAKHFGGQGTPRKGADAINAFLLSRGLHFPELRIENGSGLSRHARISTRHVGDLLVDAYKSTYRNLLMQSLAIAGVDGTMKRRLRNTPVRGRGFFKTGTLRDVRSIAGYVKASDGKTYAIAILHNDPRARRGGRAAHDKLIEWVFTGGKSTEIAMR